MHTNTKLKYLIAFGAIIIVFSYGVIVGVYKIFPYTALHHLKQESDLYVSTYGIEQVDTGLQRILLKKVKLNEEIGNGGAVKARGNIVFIFTNHGKLITFNWRDGQKIKNNVKSIPMGIDQLKKSALYENSNINLEWFRVDGAYIEKKSNNYFNIFVTHDLYDNDCIWSKMSETVVRFHDGEFEQVGNWKEVFRATPCMSSADKSDNVEKWTFYGLESGGRIIDFNKKKLLVSVGDYAYTGFSGGKSYAMDSTLYYGKTLLVDKATGDVKIYSIGMRNPEGLYKDAQGRVWETEHGPKGGDELNLIERKKNYGWPLKTLGIHYGNNPWPLNDEQGRHNSYTKPVFSWMPSIGVSALTMIEGPKFKNWQGDLLVGSLRSQSLYRLRLNGNHVVYSEKIYVQHRIRDMARLDDGSIIMITDDSYILFLEDGGPVYAPYDENDSTLVRTITKLKSYNNWKKTGADTNSAIVKTGKEIFQSNCSSCHMINGETHIAPDLGNIMGRKVGSLSQFSYSKSLKNSDKVWTKALMHNYLTDPQEVFPNNNMPHIKLTRNEISKLVAYLDSLSSH